jgi:hypothetical protein
VEEDSYTLFLISNPSPVGVLMSTTIPVQWLLIFYVVNQVASALIQSLPVPTTVSSGWYVFIYKFLNLLIADFKSFTANLPPPVFKTASLPPKEQPQPPKDTAL